MLPKTILLQLPLAIFLTGIAMADAVTDANQAILEAIRTNSTPPPKASRAMAILHTSIYDSVNGITGGYQPYAVAPAAASGASAPAAAAAATREVLTSLFPGQTATWTQNFNDFIATQPATQSTTDGVSWGSLVANTILSSRSTDGSDAITAPYTGSTAIGQWRPTSAATGLLPAWGDVTPFGVPNTTAFLPPPPVALGSNQYAQQYQEVMDYGSATSVFRTEDQTEIARFWADGAGTVTPPGHWNSIAETILPATNTLVENARIFAALNVAMADAAIVAWDAKYDYNLWRPITAINEGDSDGNALTIGDAGWVSLLATPPFPEHTSGHSTFSGAGSLVLASLLGTDNIAFSTESDILGTSTTRSFTSLSQAAEEAGQSRIYGGIHFQQANQDGMASGREIAKFVVDNYFAAVPEPSSLTFLGLTLLALGGRRRK